MVGDDIEITVLSVHGDKVRLGIDAPSEVGIFRTEVYVEIARERERGVRKEAGSEAEHPPSGRDTPDR